MNDETTSIEVRSIAIGPGVGAVTMGIEGQKVRVVRPEWVPMARRVVVRVERDGEGKWVQL